MRRTAEGKTMCRLLAAMKKAKANDKHARLVTETDRWLDNLTVEADLGAWRLEMARRTEELLKP